MSEAGSAHAATLAQALWPAGRASPALRAAVLAVAGSLLMWASAKVQVPFWPVPITMQTFAVLVIGAAYGWRLGAATMLLYLAEGAIGIPVFARGGGMLYLAGPTGGYLLSYPFVAVLVGWLFERGWGRSALAAGAALLIGNLLIYVPGLAWLSVFLALSKGLSAAAAFAQAVAAGLLPFLLGDLLKLALAAAFVQAGERYVLARRE
ncbi:MAG: biotin transporter BioY [Proteobacteria bacterium]|nr:biotin transporter BioY [Pseudomonadota bacterium]